MRSCDGQRSNRRRATPCVAAMIIRTVEPRHAWLRWSMFEQRCRRFEPARIRALLGYPGHFIVCQIRRAIDGVGHAAIGAVANLVQAVAGMAAAGVLRVMHGGMAAFQVHFTVVDNTSDEQGTHAGSPGVAGELLP